MTGTVAWHEFAASASDLAGGVRALLDHAGFIFLGTIRRDGTPRISPVELHVVGGELMVVMIPNTQKAHDVLRDPRVVVQSPVANAADPGTELKLIGRAISVGAETLRVAAADRIEVSSGWRPRPGWLFLAIGVERVAVLDWKKGEMMLTRWDPIHGVRGPERRRLDFEAGRYA